MDYYQISMIVALLVVAIIIGVVVFLLKRKKANKENEEFPELLEALGGRENIVSTTQKGSRISVVVDNKKSVDRDQVKECGIDTIVMSNKKITLVAGKRAVLMYNYLNKQLNSK